MTRRRIGVLATAIVGLFTAVPARAFHVRGIRITVTSTVGTTVNFNVTLYTDGGGGGTTTLGFPAAGTVPGVNGIDYGDGVIRASTATVRLVGPGSCLPSPCAIYRGSFSHTYPSTAARTLRVGSPHGAGVVGALGNTIVVGNPIFGPSPPYPANYAIAVTNAVTVLGSPVPTMSTLAWWLLALLLIMGGILVLRSRPEAPGT